MRKRILLKKSILLCGVSDGEVFKRTFFIDKVICNGASTVCYEAHYETSGRGVLKEFYPLKTYAIERAKDGQLFYPEDFEDDKERFLLSEKEYVEPYKILMKAKQNIDYQELSTFVPEFEIYHGCDKNGKLVGTTYIWTPEPKLETFDTICDNIHNHPVDKPEHNLVTVLLAIKYLAKCIDSLHKLGLIHRDIKPSNFGFINRQGEVLVQTLSMFDLDTICSVYSNTNDRVGTEGFIEPEAGYLSANNRSDIYSIGAVLFYAIIVTDETKEAGYVYLDEYFSKLNKMVNESKLIIASEANSHPRLRNILVQILEKCLCARASRYRDCEGLINDLEKALYYAIPSEIARNNPSSEKWILSDIEKKLDSNNKNSFLSIQYHLYENPLFKYCINDNEINVLVIGFGNYGQKFLDACLQDGQMLDKKLNVIVVSRDKFDKDIYLSERPELADFFDIDNSLEKREDIDIYGDVKFEIRQLDRENGENNKDELIRIIHKHFNSKFPHYIFVALGEDSINFSTASMCENVMKDNNAKCVIGYICEDNQVCSKESSFLFPLFVNKEITKLSVYKEIERMAFNTHLVWEKNLNISYEKIKSNFRKKYNFNSSVSSVLSLKYKLHSVHIDLDKVGFEVAADIFQKFLANKENCAIKNELIWIEHRRWVTEKLCLGWTRIKNLESCSTGNTKDEKSKQHICIVRSRPNQKLSKEFNANDSYSKWDNASIEELNELDELDRLSVELHRIYMKKADIIKKHDVLSGNNIASIRSLIDGDKKSIIAFQEWLICMKEIWHGDKDKTRLYEGLKLAFLNATSTFSDELKYAVEEQVRALEAVFNTVILSMEYRDWKQDDVALIDNIPFILTYTENAYMVIPFSTGDISNVFRNVASATVINPIKIIYLYLVEKERDIRELQNSIPYVFEYMQRKHFRATVEFVLIYGKTTLSLESSKYEEKIIKLCRDRIGQIKHIALNERKNILEKLGIYLKKRSEGKRFFAIEQNDTKLSYMLLGAGLYSMFSNYRFDTNHIKFYSIIDRCMLKYIKKMPYITVADLASFRLSSSESSNQPEFFNDYEKLWKKYTEKSNVWKALCEILADYAKNNDVIATFKKTISQKNNSTSREYHYIVPFVCNRSINKILLFLKKYGFLEQNSCINGYTTDSCEVVIIERYGLRTEYDKLFSNVYALMAPEAITLKTCSKDCEINVFFDNLVVKDVKIAGAKTTELNNLLNFFREKRYIINLEMDSNGKVRFTYATRQIKELLTTAGRILEVYTYHKVKELGKFDDIVSSFEIDWEGTEVKNEFDCILTKGFRTLFVECKARSEIEQDFYFKLASLTERFGINSTAVLVVDTREKKADSTTTNSMQRERGRMMNVITIWKSNEINDIGNTLLKVIDENYVN